MGRLWQTLILMQDFPVFEYIPFETVVRGTQDDYYEALKTSDNQGKSTVFIEYMLGVITATASRDLKKAVDMELVSKKGSKNKTVYSKRS